MEQTRHQADTPEGLVSVVIPTLGRETLRPLLERLADQRTTFPFEVVIVPQEPLPPDLPIADNVRVVTADPGLGYAVYRNIGLDAARGDPLCFIDDDALPAEDWLERITADVRAGEHDVATADLSVPLGRGYLADAISLLGFPGGAAAGWRAMWPVAGDGTTPHLCTGNCAISRRAVESVGPFDESLVAGSEDVDLGDRLVAGGFSILYAEGARVRHAERTGYVRFVRWNLRRGRSAYHLSRRRRVGGHVKGRLHSSLRILGHALKTRYGPAVLLMMATQYASQIAGYALGRFARPQR
jgi:GT2 family glycosyltransferase